MANENEETASKNNSTDSTSTKESETNQVQNIIKAQVEPIVSKVETNDEGINNNSCNDASSLNSSTSNNNNNQRLSLDILSTISNQSEIDAQENDGEQLGLGPIPEDNNSERATDSNSLENDGSTNTSPLPTSSASRSNISQIDFPSSSSSSRKIQNSVISKTIVQKTADGIIVANDSLDHIIEPSLVNCMDITWPNDVATEAELDSEEEMCTCRDYTEDESMLSSEDELPSRDVDLSGYTQSDPISEELLNDRITETPKNYRKRKLIDCRSVAISNDGKRPMISPRSIFSPSSSNTSIVTTPTTTHPEKKTPRSIIPTKDNPPPELCEWLLQFQKWSNAERLLAVDRLIEHCEPTQVRHMMKVIEPQFQRDFISLLPRELALQVLSYLEPKDLLRAAQTCRSWRFLADDNLLWKDKCRQVGILDEIRPDGRSVRRGRVGNMPPMASPWKACYVRHHTIEMNWRSRPIRSPKILKGHDDHVITCLQFCGNRIVSGSDDNTLKVWSAVTGKCLRTLVGHTGGVWSSQMSDNIIISGSTDRTLKVWDANTGECLHTLYGHTSTVRCMHLHGNKVVSGSRDATLRVWDINDGCCLHVLVGHLAAVRCVQYDGKLVVSGAYDYMVKVWNPERQECLHTLQGHTNRVYSLQFDGNYIVSGSLDTSIRVWDALTGECKHTLMGHQSLTSGMELRGNILVSGNADSTVKVWDILTGQCLQTLSGHNKHQSAVTCLQFNSKFVITSSDDGTVKLWDVKTGEFIRNLVTLESGGSGGVVWRIRANQTKLICAVGSRNGTEETKLMVLDFDVEGACSKCS